jgi:hypothetical protein
MRKKKGMTWIGEASEKWHDFENRIKKKMRAYSWDVECR